MNQQMMGEVAWAIGQFFLHPLLYAAIAAAILTGYLRVKKERKQFRTRLTWGWSEVRGILQDSWVFSLGLSGIFLLLGIVIYPEFLVLWSSIALLTLLIFQFQWLSGAYLLPIAAVAWWIFHSLSYTVTFQSLEFSGESFTLQNLWPLALLAGLFLIMESLFVRRQANDILSPQLVTTKRGGNAVQYRIKRIWLIPVILLVPGDWFSSFTTYWPVVSFGEETFALLAFPFVTGYQQTFRKSYPFEILPQRAKEFFILGIITTLIASLGILSPWFAIVALGLAFIGKLVLDLKSWQYQNTGAFAVVPATEGVQIAGVLAGSPAEKMGLQIGERIVKVNGQRIHDEQGLYEAIQINAAHCRLEVVDHNNELRLKQHVIFRHDHHRLGLILARSSS